MGIIKGLIFIIIYFSSLAVIYMTEYNTPALLCILSISLYFMMHIRHINKHLKQKTLVNQKLKEKLISQRNYFAEVLVHDLKVPTLAQLRGLELMRQELIGPIAQPQKDMICQIEQSCKYTLDMISMVLDTYQLDLEDCSLYYEKVNLPEILLESFTEVSHLAQEKDVTFTYMATQGEAVAEADRNEIKKVIVNLLGNAVLHSDRGEKILVNILTKNNSLKFSIITRGNALTEEECRTMFADYYINQPKYTAVGRDIGLYLAKKIIDAHNGKIYVSSDKIATNTFTFIIPQCRQQSILEMISPVLA